MHWKRTSIVSTMLHLFFMKGRRRKSGILQGICINCVHQNMAGSLCGICTKYISEMADSHGRWLKSASTSIHYTPWSPFSTNLRSGSFVIFWMWWGACSSDLGDLVTWPRQYSRASILLPISWLCNRWAVMLNRVQTSVTSATTGRCNFFFFLQWQSTTQIMLPWSHQGVWGAIWK